MLLDNIDKAALRGECPQGEPGPSDEETAEWVPFSEVGCLPLVEDLSLLPCLLALRPGQTPFMAHYS